MSVSSRKQDALRKKMARLNIREEDLVEKFILGSGKGGQKINKTASCVYLKHLPTNIEVKCQKDRLREMNRFFARVELCDKVTEKIAKEKTKKAQEKEKIRRQKKRRSRRLKQKILKEKKKHSEVKFLRTHLPLEEE